MSSANSLFKGFSVMVYCLVLGLALNISLAHGLDSMLVKFGEMGVFDVPSIWDSSAVVTRLVNMFYLMMYIIPMIGVAYFVLTAVRRQEYDKYKEQEVQ